ncbi:MAG: hypothetical protein HUK22_05490, partial [Thermoguttaceae bacterium]|nr:hypothetical protein [Thermoguttaceae bacterium]
SPRDEAPIANAAELEMREEIAEECFFALDPYSSFFIKYQPTAAWTEEILVDVECILDRLADNPTEASARIINFRAKINDAEALKALFAPATGAKGFFIQKRRGGLLGGKPREAAEEKDERYSAEEIADMFDAFRNALERRAFVWTRAAKFFAAKNAGLVSEPRVLGREELRALQKTTAAVQAFFGTSETGMNWRKTFEIDLMAADIEAALSESSRFAPLPTTLVSSAAKNAQNEGEGVAAQALLKRLVATNYRIVNTPMTPEQRAVFKKDAPGRWQNAVAKYSGDHADGLEPLLLFERYERFGGGQTGEQLQQCARRLAASNSAPCREYGAAFDVVYNHANVKAYVSAALINRLLPTLDPEYGVVRETMLNNPVAGSRRADTDVSVELAPDPTRLLMNLNVAGRVVASTSSEVFPAKVYNQSYATYLARKTIEWQDGGFAYSPTAVASESVNNLSGVKTEVDFLPLVGDLAREVVKSQYNSKQGEIREETRARVAREARARVDSEANALIDDLNRRLRAKVFNELDRLGLSMRLQGSKTTNDWLLASLRFGAQDSLGCQTPEPETTAGAFADVKIHESSLNAALSRLDLAGRAMTPREAVDFLAVRLNRPGLREIEIEENPLAFTFAEVDPIIVRFYEDRVQLRLNFAEISLGKSSWTDVSVAVSYRPFEPENDAQKFKLERDGAIELDGPMNIRAQLPLRTIFSKIFPAEKPLELDLKFLDTDERFAGLAPGRCRVSRGWFALAIVARKPRVVQGPLERFFLR